MPAANEALGVGQPPAAARTGRIAQRMLGVVASAESYGSAVDREARTKTPSLCWPATRCSVE
jgi:hypothetical protein